MSDFNTEKILEGLNEKKDILTKKINTYKKSNASASKEKIQNLKSELGKINSNISKIQEMINNVMLKEDSKQKHEQDDKSKDIDYKIISSEIDKEIKKSLKTFANEKNNYIKNVKSNALDDSISTLDAKNSTRQQGKDASKKEKAGPGITKRTFLHFKNSSLYKYRPKTKAAIEANNDALQDEKLFWENRIVIFKHKLLVFGDRDKKIKNAEDNINTIDKRIADNKKLLIKKDDNIINKIKDAAYKFSGAETENSQKEHEEKLNKSKDKISKIEDLEIKQEKEKKDEKKIQERNKSIEYSSHSIQKINHAPESHTNHELEDENKELENVNEAKSDTKDEKKVRKNGAIQTVSTIFNNREKDTVKVSETMVKQNEKIVNLLSEIQADDVDEQDTSVRARQIIPEEPEIQKVSEAAPKKKDDNLLSKMLGMLGLIFGPKLMKFWKVLKDSNLFKILWGALKMGANAMKFLGKHIWESLIKTGEVFKVVGNIIGKKLNKLLAPYKDKIGKIIGKFKAPFDALKSKFEGFTNKFKAPLEWLKTKIDKLKTLFGGVGKKLSAAKDYVADKVSSIKNRASDVWDGVKAKVISVKDNAIKKVSSAKDNIRKGATIIKESVIKKALALKTSAVRLSSKAMTAVKAGIGKAVKIGNEVVTSLKGKALDLAKSKVMPMIGKILGKKGLKILANTLKAVPGVSIVTGLGFGIYEAMKGHYKKAALEVISGLIGSIPVVGPALGIAASIGGGMLIDKYNSSHKKASEAIKTSKNASNTETPKKVKTVLSDRQKKSAMLIYRRENHMADNAKLTAVQIKKAIQNKINWDNDYIEQVEKNNTARSLSDGDIKSEPDDVLTNKKPKAIEKESMINAISNNTIEKEQKMYQPINQTPVPVANINSLHMTHEPEDIYLSEAFPETYQ